MSEMNAKHRISTRLVSVTEPALRGADMITLSFSASWAIRVKGRCRMEKELLKVKLLRFGQHPTIFIAAE
jgi:hypothetical protein